MTDATKGAVIALVNTLLLLLAAFNVPVTDKQTVAIGAFVNAALTVWVVATRKAPAPTP